MKKPFLINLLIMAGAISIDTNTIVQKNSLNFDGFFFKSARENSILRLVLLLLESHVN